MTSYVDDNVFPKVIMAEGTAPSAPGTAGQFTVYFDSADDHLKYKSHGGTVTDVTGGLGGGGGGGGLYSAYLCYQDQQSSGTNGGTFTSGAWQTRTLNTEVADTGNHGSVASNQITLDAGTYRVQVIAPAYSVDANQLRLQNITDSATLVVGLSSYARNSSSVMSIATLEGRFTISASKVIEVQHRCQTTTATNGFGVAASFGTEVFTTIELWKE